MYQEENFPPAKKRHGKELIMIQDNNFSSMKQSQELLEGLKKNDIRKSQTDLKMADSCRN